MNPVNSLINTSVDDARITLEGQLRANPTGAGIHATALLIAMQPQEGQLSRRQMAGAILRKAAKVLAESQERDPEGPIAGDMLAELPVGDLRKLLARLVEKNPSVVAVDILTTLKSLRGEEGHKARRGLMITALGHAIKELQRPWPACPDGGACNHSRTGGNCGDPICHEEPAA